MKGVKLKIIIGALFLITTSCAKENEDLPIDKKIWGEWIWLESKGGLEGSPFLILLKTRAMCGK